MAIITFISINDRNANGLRLMPANLKGLWLAFRGLIAGLVHAHRG